MTTWGEEEEKEEEKEKEEKEEENERMAEEIKKRRETHKKILHCIKCVYISTCKT